MPVAYQSHNLKKQLQFLSDHNYDFHTPAHQTTVPPKSDSMTQAEALSRRELKANLKIQALIDKVKRAQQHKEFYEGLAK